MFGSNTTKREEHPSSINTGGRVPNVGLIDKIFNRVLINPEGSILSQVRDPERYPNLAQLPDVYSQMRLYRE
ncbi:MAG: hypothetical protein ACFCU1_07935 [Sumerlaeia bacterium]